MSELFFVYGTLKQGYNNHYLLKESKLLGEAITKPLYQVYANWFPLAFLNPKGLPMVGEVYEIEDENTIKELDHLEGNGSFYKRAKRKVKLTNFFNDEVEAWIYEAMPDKVIGAAGYCPINTELQAYEWHP
jgi:gamma-glutamylaminecyclotransferase